MTVKKRTMSDVELVEACRSYREKKDDMDKIGKTINAELDCDHESLLVEHEGQTFSVSTGHLGDGPHFRKIRVPKSEMIDRASDS